MARRDELEEWDPKTGTSKPPRPNPIRPGGGGGSPGGGGVNIPIGPGGYMKGSNPPQYKKGGPVFEKSKKDVEPRGMKEGSAKEEAFDRKQAMPRFQKGGPVRPSEQQPPPGTMGPYKNKEKYPYDTTSERFGAGLQDEFMDYKAGFPPKPLKPGEKYARGGMVKHGSSTSVACNNKHR